MKTKKIFALLLPTLFLAQICYSQKLPLTLPLTSIGWQRIYVKNVGSFDLPPTMEIQNGKYKEFVDQVKKIQVYDAAQITAQQKGLNEGNSKGFEKYARVMIETQIGKAGDFGKINFDLTEFQTQINELNSGFKQQIQQSFSGTGQKLIEWYPLKVEKINGMSCIHICYKRQQNNNPIVFVNAYFFDNFDRNHIFTLSYRVSESEYWKADFAKILKSFRITNIK